MLQYAIKEKVGVVLAKLPKTLCWPRGRRSHQNQLSAVEVSYEGCHFSKLSSASLVAKLIMQHRKPHSRIGIDRYDCNRILEPTFLQRKIYCKKGPLVH